MSVLREGRETEARGKTKCKKWMEKKKWSA